MLNKYDPDSTDYLVNVVLYTTATDDELNGKPKTKTLKTKTERNISGASGNTAVKTYRSYIL